MAFFYIGTKSGKNKRQGESRENVWTKCGFRKKFIDLKSKTKYTSKKKKKKKRSSTTKITRETKN